MQNGRRGSNHVDHSDQRLLGHARAPSPRERQQHGGKHGKCERISICRHALGRVAEHECHRRTERRDLRERQVDKDHFAGKDQDPEIGVDADQAYRHQEGRPEKLDDIGHRFSAADVRASTFTSNSEI